MPGKSHKCKIWHIIGHFAGLFRNEQKHNDKKNKTIWKPKKFTKSYETKEFDNHYGFEIKKKERNKFFIDTGSLVTIMPYDHNLHNTKDIQPVKERYQDVNKNEINFLGTTWVKIKQQDLNVVNGNNYQ